MTQNLYLLPGTQCDDRLWEPLTAVLPETIRLHPLSIPMNLNFEGIAQHLSTELPEHPVNLLGFSLGGYTAADFAIRFPARVERLFVVSNSPKPLPEAERVQRQQALNLMERFGYRGMSRARAKALLDPAHQGDDWIDRLIEMDRAQGVERLKSQLRDTSERADLFSALAQWTKPLSFCVSEGDELVDMDWLKQLGMMNSSLNLRITEGRGHMLPLEQPTALAEEITLWLAR